MLHTSDADRAHATHAPSAAHRWMNCPGSVKLSHGFSDGGSVFAREGTAAHALAHICLSAGVDTADYRGWTISENDGLQTPNRLQPDGDTSFEVTAEMIDGVQIYLDVVRDLMANGYEMEFEQRLQTPIGPDVFGTGDAVGYNPDRRRVVIVDLKYGKGVIVEVNGNEQLLTYAAGVAMRYHNRAVDDAKLVIVQPRAFHPDGPVRVAPPVTIADLQAHVERAQVALNSDELVPGPWCKFCPAAGFCPELKARVTDAVGLYARRPGQMAIDNPEDYSPEQLAQAMEQRELIAGWLKSVDRLAHNQGMKGEPPTGWKMVYATSHRKFINPQDACEVFELYGLGRDEIFEPEQIRSPAQLEKELPKKARKVMGVLTHSPKTKLILVPGDDPRPSVDVKNVEGFEDFDFGMEE